MGTFFKILGHMLRFLLKMLLAMLVLPLGGILHTYWGKWEKTTGAKKVLLGCFFVPASVFLMVFMPVVEKL